MSGSKTSVKSMQGTRANAESAYYNTDGAGVISQVVSRHSNEHIVTHESNCQPTEQRVTYWLMVPGCLAVQQKGTCLCCH
jgi:hypothetical protein